MTRIARPTHGVSELQSNLRSAWLAAIVSLLAFMRAHGQATNDVVFTQQEIARIVQHSPLGPPRPNPTNRVADDPRAARLGQFLFFDTRLSANGKVSCATCHVPGQAFTDGRPTAVGLAATQRHAPTLINAAYNRWYFWDGRADSLWSQALQPIEHPDELGSSRWNVAQLIANDSALRASYEQIFGPLGVEAGQSPSGLQAPNPPGLQATTPSVDTVFVNVGKAIEAYERKLVSFNSPFDIFVQGLRTGNEGKMAALSASAKRGLKLFVGKGECRLCHSGPNFTDGEFHDIGLPQGPAPSAVVAQSSAASQQPATESPMNDPGRLHGIEALLNSPFNAAGPYSDDRTGAAAQRLEFLAAGDVQMFGQFKTPTLRNVAITPPYMHDGQFQSLTQVVEFYSTLQGSRAHAHGGSVVGEAVLRPREFTKSEIADLIAFLESLTDFNLSPELLGQPPSPLWESAGP